MLIKTVLFVVKVFWRTIVTCIKFIVQNLVQCWQCTSEQSKRVVKNFMQRLIMKNTKKMICKEVEKIETSEISGAIALRQLRETGINALCAAMLKNWLFITRMSTEKITLLKTYRRFAMDVMAVFIIPFYQSVSAKKKVAIESITREECVFTTITSGSLVDNLVSSFKLREGWSYDQPFSLAYE